MSIELNNPQTVKELVDAAWNYVEQARLAMMVGDRKHLETAIGETSRLLSVAMDKLEQDEARTTTFTLNPTPPGQRE